MRMNDQSFSLQFRQKLLLDNIVMHNFVREIGKEAYWLSLVVNIINREKDV